MKNIFILTALILLSINLQSYGQLTHASCKELAEKVDSEAVYKNGMRDIQEYIRTDLLVELKDCIFNMEDAPRRIVLVLTIDEEGNVIDGIFPKNTLSTFCQIRLQAKLLKMKGWKAAIKDGKSVCSKITLPIACLKWSE